MTDDSADARRRQLMRPGAIDRLVAEASARVVRWRSATGGVSLHDPEPFVAERSGAAPGRWLRAGEDASSATLTCGFDEAGDAVIANWRRDGIEGVDVIVRDRARDQIVRSTRPGAGEPAHLFVTLFERDAHDRVVVAVGDGGYRAEFSYEADGDVTIEQLEREGTTTLRRTYRVHRGSDARALTVVQVRSGGDVVMWEAQQPEDDLLMSFEQIAERVGPGLRDAVVRAVDDAVRELPSARVCVLRAVARDEPVAGAVLDRSHLEEAVRDGVPDRALEEALLAVFINDPTVRGIDPMTFADDETRGLLEMFARRHRAIAKLPSAAREDERAELRASARRLVLDVARELQCSRPALVVVPWKVPAESTDGGAARAGADVPTQRGRAASMHGRNADNWRAGIENAGWTVVNALWEELRAPAFEPRLPTRRPHTREELLALLHAIGLERHADAILARCREAISLELDDAAGGTSRLGGIPPWPAGRDWPLTDGRPMTPIVTIDCSALPAIDDRDLLPADGTLVVFAEMGKPLPDGLGRQLLRPGARAVHVAERTSTTTSVPGAPVSLPRRLLRLGTVLTLPDSWVAPGLFGFTIGELHRYQGLLGSLRRDPEQTPAQLLGHPEDAEQLPQGASRLLIEIDASDAAGIHIPGDGALLLSGTDEQLREQRWNELKANA